MKRKFLLAFVIATMAAQTALANTCNYDVTNKTVKFSVNTTKKQAAVVVTGADDQIIYIKTIETKDGKASAEFGVPSSAPSGKYELSVGDSQSPVKEFRHINATQAADAIEALKTANETNIKSTLITYADDLGIDETVLNTPTTGDAVAGYFYQLKPTQLTAENFYGSYILALVLKDTNGLTDKTVIDNILKENAALLGLDYAAFSDYPQETKDEFYSRFQAANITEPNNPDIVKIWLALARFNNTISWNDYKNWLLTDYSTVLGIDQSVFNNVKAQVIIQEIMNNGSYDTKSGIAGSYTTVCGRYPVESGSSQGSGGGGGGGGASPVLVPDKVETPTVSVDFSDLPSTHWAFNVVKELADKGIVSGDNGRFNPDSKITRAEFCTLIARAFYENETAGEGNFSDVNSTDWFSKYVSILAAKKIVNGMGDSKFAPANMITREDMAVIVQRCASDLGLDLTAKKESYLFTDDESFSSYSKDAAKTLYEAGIISGMPDGSFKPKQNLTKAEAAVVIYGMLNR